MDNQVINTSVYSSSHPEFPYEESVHQGLIDSISSKLSAHDPYSVPIEKEWEVYGGADERTASVFHYHAIQDYEELKSFLIDPYIGRLDFRNEMGDLETYYIGKRPFEFKDKRIINWAAPVGSLFSRSPKKPDDTQVFITVDGKNTVTMLLKRNIRIEQQKLIGLFDQYDFRTGQGIVVNNNLENKLLTEVLDSRGSPYLQDIVRTIQEEQDELIREKPNCYLLINGVAGSGKTSIAYHRLAVLLYFEEDGKGVNLRRTINPNNVIVFGPSRLFMSYVKELLPELGVKGVQQTSFDDWALAQMGYMTTRTAIIDNEKTFKTESKYRLLDSAIRVFLDRTSSREQKTLLWRKARIKGGLKYKTFITKYIDHKTRQWKISSDGYKFSTKSLPDRNIKLSPVALKEIRQSLDLKRKPINIQRGFYLSKIKELLNREYKSVIDQMIGEQQKEIDTKYIEASFDQETIKILENKRRTFLNEYFGFQQKEIIEDLFQQARTYLDQECPFIDAYEEYYALMGNHQLVTELSKGLFSKEEVEVILNTEKKSGVIELEDIPAIFYLHLLANGKSDTTFDHIVIDEAQDFSLFQYFILDFYNPRHSMTILGDLNQGIYAHRGLQNWEELSELLGTDEVIRHDVNVNYRSTNEITIFTNAMLRQKSKNKAVLSIPFERKGETPKLIQASSKTRMYEQIVKDIRAYNSQGIRNIGIIVKKYSEVEETYKNLSGITDAHFSCTLTRDDEFSYEGGNLIIPVDLSKGIEFEAVMVVNADRKNYDSEVDYDGRLLYVAISRALHGLSIYSDGELTPYFDQAKKFADYRSI